MSKVYNVELNFPSGAWRTVQKIAETSVHAAHEAISDYPAADEARAWLPGGAKGLERTETALVTSLSHRLGVAWTGP
jgi:hypothetical protein